MSEVFAMDAGIPYAFAPSPDSIKGAPHRIHMVFNGSDGRCWSTDTNLMAVTQECDRDLRWTDSAMDSSSATEVHRVRIRLLTCSSDLICG